MKKEKNKGQGTGRRKQGGAKKSYSACFANSAVPLRTYKKSVGNVNNGNDRCFCNPTKRIGTLFLLLTLILTSITLVLSLDSSTNPEKLMYLSVEKQYYELGEKISLIITAQPLSDYELSISSGNNYYKYSGELKSNVNYYPKEEGVHQIQLTRKQTRENVERIQIIVIEETSQSREASQAISTIQPPHTEEKGKTKQENCPVTTNKKKYYIGEEVIVIINVTSRESYNLYYEYQGLSQKYMGKETAFTFTPKGIGIHNLILWNKEKQMIICNYSFEIKEKPQKQAIKRPVLLRDSKGKVLDAKINLFNKNNEEISAFKNIIPPADNTSSTNTSITPSLSEGLLKNSFITEIIPSDNTVEKIRIRGLKGKINLGLEKVHPLKNPVPQRYAVSSYALDPTQTNFTNATITKTAQGTELWKCKDYNFTTQTCYGEWKKIMNLAPGQNYTFLLTPEDPLYSETLTNLSCSCQDSATSVNGNPERATCSVFCSTTIDVPENAETGYLMNMSFGVEMSITGDGSGHVTSASHRGRFDRDQTYGNGNESSIGTSTSTTSFTTTWTNASINPTGDASFTHLNCDNWPNNCTWYVYLYSTAVVDAPGRSTKSITINLSLLNLTYAWNYTEEGNLSITLNWPDSDHLNYQNLTFNYTPKTTGNLTNCTLYTNKTGVFTNESTDYNATDNESNYFNLSFGSDGAYKWNVHCYDDQGNDAWAPNNKTFTIDTIAPSVSLESPEDGNSTTEPVVSFYYNVTDLNNIANCSLIIDGETKQTDQSITKNTTQSFSYSPSNGEHTWAVWCYDHAGNLDKSENRSINISTTRRIWSDRWYETGTSDYSGSTATIELDNQTDGTQNQAYYNIPTSTTITLVNATSPYIGGEGGYIADGSLITFRASFTEAQDNGYVSWHLYKVSTNGSKTEMCSYGNDGASGSQVAVITEETCTTSSEYRLLGTDKLRLVINVYNNHPAQPRAVNHSFDHTNSYADISNFQTLGYLEADLEYPTTNIVIGINETYNHTCNVTCIDGTCLNTKVYAQYNTSSQGWMNISSAGNLVLNSTETNPHNIGNISNSTSTTFIIRGNQGSVNNIRCYASSKYSKDTGPTTREVIVSAAPVVTLTKPDDENYTDKTTATFFFTVSDNTNITSCLFILNGSVNATKNSSEITNGGENNFTVSNLAETSYTWTVNCTDTDNNTGTDTPRTIYIDLTNPWITLNYPEPNETIAYDRVNFNWTAYDNYNVNMSCDLYINDTLNQSSIPSPNGTPTNFTVHGLVVGSYTWHVNCSDMSSRRNVSETRNFTIIDVQPTVTLEYPSPESYVNSSTVTFQYNASDNNDLQNCTLFLDGQENETNSTIANNQINNFTINGLSQGLHNWTVRCIDTGNLTDTAAWQNFTVDLTDPYVLLYNPAPAQALSDGDVTFNYTAVDNYADPMSCELFLDGSSESNDSANNNSPTYVNINNIQDGFHQWNVTCQDDSGRKNTSATQNFTINQSPSINLGTPGQGNVTNKNITFTYTPSDNDGFTNCTLYIDGNPNATNTTIYDGALNNFTVTGLTQGNHTWYIECYDNGTYLNSNTSITRNFTVDTTDPNVTLNYPGPEELVESSTTNFNWTSQDNYDTNLSCDLYIDSTYNQTVWSASGNWTNTSVELNNGRYNWYVICYDDANNSGQSATNWFNVSVPPSINLTFPEPDEYMNYIDLMFEYIPSANTNITNCTLYIDGQENETNHSITADTYNYFWINVTQDQEGKHNWTVRCIDADGLEGWAQTQDYYLDYTEPGISLHQPPDNDTLSRNRVFFNFTMTDSTSPNASCTIYVDGAPAGINLIAYNDTPREYNKTYPDGNYSWYVNCTDYAGNNNVSETWNFTIIAPPNVTLISPSNGNHTNANYLNLTYVPEDDYVIPNCTLYLNGSPYMNDTSINTNQNNSFDIIGLGEGYYNWTVYCTDQDGNTYGPPAWNFTIDQTPPVPSLYLPQPAALLTSEDVLFNFTATDSLDTQLYCNLTINGSVNESNIPVSNGSWRNITVNDLLDSTYFWNITCWDRAHNNQTSETRNFTVQSPPRIALGNPYDGYRNKTTNVTFYFTPTDNSGNISNCTVILNGQPNETLTNITNGIEHNITVYNLTNGTYTWTVNCTDINGNEGTNSSAKTFYIDLLGPTIELNFPTPAQIVGYDDITFNWTPTDFNNTNITCNLTVDDNDTATSITNLSGYDFIKTIYALSWGTHLWNVTCWDDLGNNNTSETRNFTITRPDLTINTNNISFNNTNPDENDSILINATIQNMGGADGNNTLVQFWDGEPGAGGTWIANTTIDVPGNTSKHTNATWNISLGYHTIWIIIDPNNNVEELNDDNNNATKNISILRVIINSPPNQTFTNDTTPKTNFTMQDFTGGNINYTIYVDGTLNGQTGSSADNTIISINLTALNDGTHNIIIQAEDALNRRKNSSTLVITIDSNAPVVNFETPNNYWFNTSSPNIYFNITDSVDTNINYSIYLNSSFKTSDNTSNHTTQNYTFSGLTDSSYNVTIQATDDINNSENYSIIIYVDTRAPGINLTWPDNNENITTEAFDLNFTATDNMDSSLTCNLTLDGSVYRNNFEASSGQITPTQVSGLSEGTHQWNVTCWDNATNKNTSETRSFNTFTAPIVNLTAPQDNNITDEPKQTFIFNVSDETGIYNCTLYLNGQANQSKPGSQIINNATNNFTVNNLNGSYNWQVVCHDNTSLKIQGTSETWNLIVDLDAPAPSITTTNYTWFNTSTPSIDFIITDNFADPINYTFNVNSTANRTGSSANNTPDSANLISLNNNASWRVVLQATDEAGNTANSTTVIIYTDTVKPSVNLSAPEPGQEFNTTTVEFNFTAYDNMAGYLMCNLSISNGMYENNINASRGVLQNITKGGFESGTYYWNVTCADQAGNTNLSDTWNFTILAPDLVITTGNISFNDTSPEEGKNITIYANIYNNGGGPARNTTVQFWKGDPDSGGTQINSNKTITLLNPNNNYTVNITYTPNISINNIFVIVDPPLASNGSIAEEDETNNKANNSFTVGSYHVFAGNTTGRLHMEKQSINSSLFTWNVSNATGSNIFVTDLEADPDFNQLQAISRDVNNNSASNNDFEEIDQALGSTNHYDSINNTYTTNNNPKATKTYTVFYKDINNVPIINSTNTSNFQTGILWDKSDGGTQYNGTQDIIFISQVNKQKQGGRGTYDFEIKVPALLRNYNAAGSTIAFYAEIR